jgi:catechol 2,3-dioxygenase-like lactoylglutathione lyase family enzyme
MVERVTVLFGGIPVRDFEAALPWYERLLGRPPDMVPKEGEVCWKFTDDAWIYVVRDAERAGNALITIIVDELPEIDAELVEMGGMLTVEATDPEGNKIKFGRPR